MKSERLLTPAILLFRLTGCNMLCWSWVYRKQPRQKQQLQTVWLCLTVCLTKS